MSAAITHPIADATTSAFDQVKSGVIDVANWLGRQVTWLMGSLKTIAERVIETAKPVFTTLVNFVREQAVKLKDLVTANPPVSIVVIGVPALALFIILGSYLFGSTSAAKVDGKTAQTEPKKV